MNFADMHAGKVIDLRARTVTTSEILDFARQFDPQPYHVDPAAAGGTRWQGLIASGFHTCSLAMRMVVDEVLQGADAVGAGLDYLNWPNPVKPGDTLTLRLEVLEAKRSSSGRTGIVRWRWLMRNQHAAPVLDLVATTLFSIAKAQ